MKIFHRRVAEALRKECSGSRALRLRVPLSLRLALLLTLPLLVSCSVPNLEPQDCTAARTPVREFYSFHFGNDMMFAPENLEKRREYLTPEFYGALHGSQSAGDPFTLREDLPKAFRVGACRSTDSGVQFDVLLFWKTDTRSEQQSIKVDLEDRGGKWLVSRVTN